jgi:hypothetical protein
MTTVITKQKEDISEKLRLIETLDVSREQKDRLIEYVKFMNIQTIFISDCGTVEFIDNA